MERGRRGNGAGERKEKGGKRGPDRMGKESEVSRAIAVKGRKLKGKWKRRAMKRGKKERVKEGKREKGREKQEIHGNFWCIWGGCRITGMADSKKAEL